MQTGHFRDHRPDDDILDAMCGFLGRVRPDSPSGALGALRAAFPDARLDDRVRACVAWRHRDGGAGSAIDPRVPVAANATA